MPLYNGGGLRQMVYFWKQQDDLPAGIGYGLFNFEHIVSILVVFILVAVSAIIINHLCEEMKNGKLNPLTVGVKCAVLFELPKKGKSYYYDYNKVERGYIKRGGNQSIQ